MDMQQLAAEAQGQQPAPTAGADPKVMDMLTQARAMIDQAMQMMGAGASPEAAQQAGFESVDQG